MHHHSPGGRIPQENGHNAMYAHSQPQAPQGIPMEQIPALPMAPQSMLFPPHPQYMKPYMNPMPLGPAMGHYPTLPPLAPTQHHHYHHPLPHHQHQQQHHQHPSHPPTEQHAHLIPSNQHIPNNSTVEHNVESNGHANKHPARENVSASPNPPPRSPIASTSPAHPTQPSLPSTQENPKLETQTNTESTPKDSQKGNRKRRVAAAELQNSQKETPIDDSSTPATAKKKLKLTDTKEEPKAENKSEKPDPKSESKLEPDTTTTKPTTKKNAKISPSKANTVASKSREQPSNTVKAADVQSVKINSLQNTVPSSPNAVTPASNSPNPAAKSNKTNVNLANDAVWGQLFFKKDKTKSGTVSPNPASQMQTKNKRPEKSETIEDRRNKLREEALKAEEKRKQIETMREEAKKEREEDMKSCCDLLQQGTMMNEFQLDYRKNTERLFKGKPPDLRRFGMTWEIAKIRRTQVLRH